MDLSKLTAYEVLEERDIPDLNSRGAIVRHKKTGAKITLLSNDDENKVFYIGFRTPPTDSTGVAHIIEHSVLCGSQKYPVKDPFVELAKGSLNTFLNAITYPDKTVYPVASCNEKDFNNLMDVYLDAVFHPNIYKEEKIFRQEGWHYECESEEEELIYNGVVYNEMKGAYSSADDLLDRETLCQLYPDTAYGVDSGGEPSQIPTLSYEDYLSFHKKYYHPSNSYIYLYGDMDMEKKLDYLDKEYLSKYDFLSIDSELRMQKPFKDTHFVTKQYPVLESDDISNAAYFSYNVTIGTSLDKELYLALQILDYALCSAPGAPVKVALQSKGIGEDVYSFCENGILQPYFSFVAKNANPEDKDRFLYILEETLNDLVANGIDKNSLLAAINYFEFKYREADYGSYPKGLMYGLQALDSWLYDERLPFIHIEANDTFASLKKKAQTGYFEKIVLDDILNNTHKVVITMLPCKGMEKANNEAVSKKLQEYKNSLSKNELNKIISDTKELKIYQDRESSAEELAKIPVLERSDLKKEADKFVNDLIKYQNTQIVTHPFFTNGVSYFRVVFDVRDIDKEDIQYLSLLKNILGLVNTKDYSYGELYNQINLKTGGISININTYINANELDKFKMTFEVKAKTLYENTQEALDLIKEILFYSKINDETRIKDILGELKSRMQAHMTNAGHNVSALRAMSYISESAWAEEQMSGICFYRFISDILENFDSRKTVCIDKMNELLKKIMNKNRVLYDYTGTGEGLNIFINKLDSFHCNLSDENNMNKPFHADLSVKNEGFCTSAGIQYVCRAGSFEKAGLKYTGALRVLKIMMGYDYLWVQVRVKGGAYGCMSNFSKAGLAYYVSYRDPNLERTIEIYENAPKYLSEYKSDEVTMTKYVIGAIAEKDTPLNPNAKGGRSFNAYMSDYTFEQEQKERDEILQCSQEDIHRLADYADAMLGDHVLCVVGNEEKIREANKIFNQIEPLL